MNNFGSYLRDLRKQSGYSSQDDVIDQIQSILPEEEHFSKSLLSLYEQGKVKTPSPEALAALAKVYNVSVEELAGRWFANRFGFEPTHTEEKGFVKNITSSDCILQGPSEHPDDQISIISLSEFRETQSKLPCGSQVGVVAIDFLDDNIFFEMVAANINNQIQYHYFMPEDEHVTYKAFLSQVIDRYPELDGKLDGKRTHFTPRANLDFPTNCVVYIYPSGQIQGYVGLLLGKRVQYMQVADAQLSWRLFDGFRWALTVDSDRVMQKRVSELQSKIGHGDFQERRKGIQSFL